MEPEPRTPYEQRVEDHVPIPINWVALCVASLLVLIAAGTTISAVNAIQQMQDRKDLEKSVGEIEDGYDL